MQAPLSIIPLERLRGESLPYGLGRGEKPNADIAIISFYANIIKYAPPTNTTPRPQIGCRINKSISKPALFSNLGNETAGVWGGGGVIDPYWAIMGCFGQVRAGGEGYLCVGTRGGVGRPEAEAIALFGNNS